MISSRSEDLFLKPTNQHRPLSMRKRSSQRALRPRALNRRAGATKPRFRLLIESSGFQRTAVPTLIGVSDRYQPVVRVKSARKKIRYRQVT